MKPGQKVLVTRGSNHHAMNLRTVRGTVIAMAGNEVIVRLDQNDESTSVGYCTRQGDVGRWSRSCVRGIKEI